MENRRPTRAGYDSDDRERQRLTNPPPDNPSGMRAHPGREWDTADWVSDPRAAREALGWTPTVDLAEGLARTWRA